MGHIDIYHKLKQKCFDFEAIQRHSRTLEDIRRHQGRYDTDVFLYVLLYVCVFVCLLFFRVTRFALFMLSR